MGLMRQGWTREEVLAAYCKAMADHIFSLVERGGVSPGFAVTGGMAKNRGVMDRLMKKIGIERMQTQWDTQIAGAAGAALFAYALCLKGEFGRRKLEGGGWKVEVRRRNSEVETRHR
jgi:benzoyl-CoA reductase subunit A